MLKNKFKPICNELNEYEPGKTKTEISQKYNIPIEEIIALASNENPYGAPKRAQKAIKEVLSNLHRYPTPQEEKELKRAIKTYLGLPEPYKVILGAGEDGVLENIFNTFIDKNDQVTIPFPTFSLYEISSKVHGAKIDFVERKKDFSIPQKKLLDSAEKSKLTFICSPNNPTGNLINSDLLAKLLKKDTIVVLDAAYSEFTEKSYIDLLENNDNLIILRTLSKAFGLAGLRAGYAVVGNKEIAKNMKKIKSPFTVSKPALVAGKEALRSKDFLEKTKETVMKQRKFLEKNIPFKTSPSEANFVVANVSPKSSTEITEQLMKRGLIVRDCSAMKGMKNHYIRVTVGKPQQNKKAIEAMKEL